LDHGRLSPRARAHRALRLPGRLPVPVRRGLAVPRVGVGRAGRRALGGGRRRRHRPRNRVKGARNPLPPGGTCWRACRAWPWPPLAALTALGLAGLLRRGVRGAAAAAVLAVPLAVAAVGAVIDTARLETSDYAQAAQLLRGTRARTVQVWGEADVLGEYLRSGPAISS